MEYGFIMIETRELEEKLQEKKFKVRNKILEQESAATRIQRAYRKYKGIKPPIKVLSVIQPENNEIIIQTFAEGEITIKIFSQRDLKSFPKVTLYRVLEDLQAKSESFVEDLTSLLTIREELRDLNEKHNKRIQSLLRKLCK